MKFQMKREALEKINRQANEMHVLGAPALWHSHDSISPIRAQFVAQSGAKMMARIRSKVGKCFRMSKAVHVGA